MRSFSAARLSPTQRKRLGRLAAVTAALAALVFDLALRYVKEGSLRPHKWANVLLWIMIIALLAFGVLRNL